MIGKITTGKDFRGIVNYLLEPTKTPKIIDSNILSGNRKDIIWELSLCAELNSRCKNPVKHISLSFAPTDGYLFDQTVLDITDAIIEGLGYNNNQLMVVKHGRIDPGHDRTHNHDHVHILLNMVGYDGQRVKDSFDKRRLEKILREQEKLHGLTQVPSSDQRKYKTPTTGQVQRLMREMDEIESGERKEKPKAPYMSLIQSGIDLASHDKPSLKVFLARLQRLSIDPKFRLENGEVEGISYRMQDFKVRGCKLHNSSLPKLIEHRVELDSERDLIAIEMVDGGEELELAPELEVNWSQTNIRDYVPEKMKRRLDEFFGENEVEEISPADKAVELEKPEESKKFQPQKNQDWEWSID
ncbi:MAG: relaxase/mobilization nuclease domain-containing protein [Pleurocapsa sp. MO_192.B19]|nr:relaxase/mobilization nuclease domain-containing protein [Pleurocapsa sp. MO_192.B19]